VEHESLSAKSWLRRHSPHHAAASRTARYSRTAAWASNRLIARQALLLGHVCPDQARIDRKPFAANQPSRDALRHRALENLPQASLWRKHSCRARQNTEWSGYCPRCRACRTNDRQDSPALRRRYAASVWNAPVHRRRMIRRFLTASPSPISGDNAGNSRRQSAQKPAAEDPPQTLAPWWCSAFRRRPHALPKTAVTTCTAG
jgi:hypothetical protein